MKAQMFKSAVLLLALAGLVAGLVLQGFGAASAARLVWVATTLPVLLVLLREILLSLLRGDVGLDVVAALSMASALLIGETLAAAVVAVMYSGGTFLESYAEGRARKEMKALLTRAPRVARVYSEDGLVDRPLEAIRPSDRLLIRQGDIVPVDGVIASSVAFLDTSALTGESLPQRLGEGDEAMSGSTNAGEAFDLVASRMASESTFAGIVRLVEEAQQSKAPMARLADRWSLAFLLVTVALAVAAYWLTGDPVRGVAVLVVATPCPLILAVPVALVAGLSRAAQFGVLVKGAGPLEAMANIHSLILDKTGTLTDGRPQIDAIHDRLLLGENEVLRLAASLDQASKHPVGQALVTAAQARGLALGVPAEVAELPGEGLTGRVDGQAVAVGGFDFIARQIGEPDLAQPEGVAGSVIVSVAVEGKLAGHILMTDPLREGAQAMIERLRGRGIRRILLATGDRRAVAERVTDGLGLDEVHASLTPDRKVSLVKTERDRGRVMMVGDGVNDAPALAIADIGVAMGARGASASAEAADAILLVDRIDRLCPGIEIAQKSRQIALESVAAGIGLSFIGMVFAAFGYLKPVEGALLQEVIDVAVILNALRALRIKPDLGGL